VLVAASSECYPEFSLRQVCEKLVDLEYSNIEIALFESGNHLKPSVVAANVDAAIDRCLDTSRLDVIAYDIQIEAEGEEYYRQFSAICKLAKATKVVTLTVPSGELGTPFNEEVEKLRRLVDIAVLEGARVSIKSQVGRLSQDPDTVVVLCDNVKGLGVTMDPSHYICGPHKGRIIEKLNPYVHHVHLRDTSKEEMQVRVGQGEVEYGKLIGQLGKCGYSRGLSVNITESEGIDHMAEMRKMRLLLESLL
jgi:sugar phosphate isomerase/epimerase